MKKKLFRKNRIGVVFLALTIALAGCGFSDSGTESDGSGSATGEGVAAERYTADFNGHTYQFIDVDTTWEDARKACASRDGHLVTITSAEEQKYLEGLFTNISGSDAFKSGILFRDERFLDTEDDIEYD